jgi:hypothetical protein
MLYLGELHNLDFWQILVGFLSKEDEMGGTCGTYGENRYTRDQSLKESDQLEDVFVGEMILLKWALKE